MRWKVDLSSSIPGWDINFDNLDGFDITAPVTLSCTCVAVGPQFRLPFNDVSRKFFLRCNDVDRWLDRIRGCNPWPICSAIRLVSFRAPAGPTNWLVKCRKYNLSDCGTKQRAPRTQAPSKSTLRAGSTSSTTAPATTASSVSWHRVHTSFYSCGI